MITAEKFRFRIKIIGLFWIVDKKSKVMAADVGPREKAKVTQTLIPFLRGLIGSQVIVELKNELQASGTVVGVDAFMNISMENVQMSSPNGTFSRFSMFFLQRKSIRSLQIPPSIPIHQTLVDQVDIVTGKKARREREKVKKKRSNFLKKKTLKSN